MSSPGQPRRIHGDTLALANENESDKEKLPTMYKPSLVKFDEALQGFCCLEESAIQPTSSLVMIGSGLDGDGNGRNGMG
jgi:hypothetical protein